jgi:hypothetical protein
MEPAVLDTFFQSWLGKVETQQGDGGTLARHKDVVERFVDSLGTRRSIQMADLLPEDVQAFVDALAESGKSIGGYNDHPMLFKNDATSQQFDPAH